MFDYVLLIDKGRVQEKNWLVLVGETRKIFWE